jgi:hypothetical protein
VETTESIARLSRIERQRRVNDWAVAAFGVAQAINPKQRALRLLEEAVEAYQAVGGDKVMAHLTIDIMFERPAGDPAQELGGLGVTLLALAAALGLSADHEEAREIARVLAKPIDHWAARNRAKNALGLDATKAAP